MENPGRDLHFVAKIAKQNLQKTFKRRVNVEMLVGATLTRFLTVFEGYLRDYQGKM